MHNFLKSFTYAFKGWSYAFSTQLNFKVHTVAAATVIFAGCYFRLSHTEWLWIIAATGLVLIVELINTAIEVLVGLVSPGYHPKAGIIKDVSAAAVLITALTAVAIGLMIFIPKILAHAP